MLHSTDHTYIVIDDQVLSGERIRDTPIPVPTVIELWSLRLTPKEILRRRHDERRIVREETYGDRT